MRSKTKTVSVRLDHQLLDLLQERASALGLSSGLWMRKLVENELLRPFDAELLDKKLSQLRKNQAISLYYILTVIGDVAPDKASELVRTKLMKD
ncbi:MAG: hypothetical protein U0930_12305 [Pirellulales bacterium]